MPKPWAEKILSDRIGDAADLVLALNKIVEVKKQYAKEDFK